MAHGSWEKREAHPAVSLFGWWMVTGETQSALPCPPLEGVARSDGGGVISMSCNISGRREILRSHRFARHNTQANSS